MGFLERLKQIVLTLTDPFKAVIVVLKLKSGNSKLQVFLYAALSGVKVSLVGQLGVNELLAIVSSFSIKSWVRTFKNVPDIRNISIAYLVMLMAQIASDIINNSSSKDYLRGWAAILVAVTVTVFLTKQLWNSTDCIIYYFLGEIITKVLFGYQTEGVDLEDASFFKFRLIPIINNLVLIISYFLLRKKPDNKSNSLTIFLIWGLFCMAYDARSNGAFWILTSIVLFSYRTIAKINIKTAIPYLLVFAIIFQGLYTLYVSSVLEGKIGGEHTQSQFEVTSNPYNPLNLLIAGRPETFTGIQAIKDKPLWGHGSWAKDYTGKYFLYLLRLFQGEAYLYRYFESNDDLSYTIPSHSVLIGTWLYSGIFGFFGIFYIMIIFLKRCFSIFKYIEKRSIYYLPTVTFLMLNSFWDFLFSPLGHIRETLPIAIAFIVVLHRKIIIKSNSGKRIIKPPVSS